MYTVSNRVLWGVWQVDRSGSAPRGASWYQDLPVYDHTGTATAESQWSGP